MLTTLELIAGLNERGVLSPSDVQRLLRLYEYAPSEFGPRVLTKWLISQGKLTAEQGDALSRVDPKLPASEALDRAIGPKSPASGAAATDDELGLVPLDDEAPDDAAMQSRPAPSSAAESGRSPAVPKRAAAAAAPAKNARSDLLDELLQGVDPLAMPSFRKPRRVGWDSPLMLVGGGGLLVLVLGALFLWWRIGRDQGDEAFASAEDAYNQAAYPLAIERFSAFLAAHPRHTSAGTAIVHRGMAQIRIETESAADWSRALATSRQVLAEIAPHEEFATVRADVGVLVPEIAGNLAKQALERNDPRLLETAREARALVDKYAAGNEQAVVRLTEVDSLLATADRRLAQELRIAETVAAMRKALTEGDLNAAFAARGRLLEEYVDAAQAPRVVEATAEIGAAAAKAVKFVAAATPAETTEPDSPVVRRDTLLHYRQPSTSTAAADGEICLASARGVIFALEATTGKLRWRRDVGIDSRFVPQKVASSAGTVVVMDDVVRHELVAVDVATGRLRYRAAIPSDDDAWLAVAADRLLLTTGDGRLTIIDAADGRTTGVVRFPEPLVGESVADSRDKVRYQLSRSGRLYVLDARTLACLEAVGLGYEAGQVALPPICAGSYLAVIQTPPNGGSQIRFFSIDAAGRGLKAVGVYQFDDAVRTPARISRKVAVVVGERGGFAAFDLSRAEDAEPAIPMATRPAEGPSSELRFLSFLGNEIWSTDDEFRRFDLQPAVGKIVPLKALPAHGKGIAAPQTFGELVVDVRQDADGSLRVIAVKVADYSPAWQSDLSPAVAAGPLYDAAAKRVVVASSRHVFAPAVAAGRGGAVEPLAEFATVASSISHDRATRPALLAARPATVGIFLPDEVPTEADGVDPSAERVGRFVSWLDLQSSKPELKKLTLPQAASVAPLAAADGLISAGTGGRITWIESATGEMKSDPFQPPVTAGVPFAWSELSSIDRWLTVADRAGRLFSVELDPAARTLRAGSSIDLSRKVVAGPVAVGGGTYLVDDRNMLTYYALPDLKPGDDWELPSKPAWGPLRVGDAAYLAVLGDDGFELWSLDGDGRRRWRSTVTTAANDRCSPPAVDGRRLFVATLGGEIVELDVADGSVRSRVGIGVPLVVGPVVADDFLVVTSAAGEVLWLKKP